MSKTLEEQMAELIQQNLSAKLVEGIFKDFDPVKMQEILTNAASEKITEAIKSWHISDIARKAAEDFVREKIVEVVKEELSKPEKIEELRKATIGIIDRAFTEAVTAIGKRIARNLANLAVGE